MHPVTTFLGMPGILVHCHVSVVMPGAWHMFCHGTWHMATLAQALNLSSRNTVLPLRTLAPVPEHL